MPSLQETVEQQAATIQQLSEIVAKSEARHRSLERAIRWMGIGVFVLAVVLVMPIKQDLFSVAHATTSPEQQSPVNNMLCGSAGQLLMNMPCGEVKKMVMGLAKMENLKNTPLGYSDGFLNMAGDRIVARIVKDSTDFINLGLNEVKQLKKLGISIDEKAIHNQRDIAGNELQQVQQMPESKDSKELKTKLAKLDIATGAIKVMAGILNTADAKVDDKEIKSLAESRAIKLFDILEQRRITEIGANLTLMDHVANIDYDFDNLTAIGRIIPQLIGDMNNMSDQMTVMSAQMSNMDENMENMSGRMDTMARDMHNMNSMAFDIHNMAATGVPVMGRMNNATSWMPWW